MACLSEETVSELVHGRLAPEGLQEAEEHLAGCAQCRRVVAELARSATPPRRSDGGSQGPTPADPVGSVGRYALGQQLGAGSMGVVFEGHDPQLHRRIAVKLLRSEGEPERLLREARAMAQLAHPNVVSVYDAGTYEGGVFIAMELVEGITLSRWMASPTRHGSDDVLRVFDQAGRGLESAHARGIVHRDFKPDNVLIGSDGRTRVTDFGLARTQATSRPRSRLPWKNRAAPLPESSDHMAGTPAYMAPEQFAGAQVDPRTDQFAFCVALHEALYGQRPFVGKTHLALAQAVIAARLKTPPGARGASPELFAVLRRGLSRLPADRYPTMTELLAALAAAAEQARARGAPTAVVPALPRTRRLPSLRATLLAVVAACGMVSLGAATVLTWRKLQPGPRLESPVVAPGPGRERAFARHSPERAEVPSMAAGQGLLRLRAPSGTPPLSITLDGEPRGETPQDLRVSQGAHRLALSNARAHILIPDRRVDVVAGEVTDPVPSLLDPHPHPTVAPPP